MNTFMPAYLGLARRMPPPVAICHILGRAPTPVFTNRELNAILAAEDIEAVRAVSSMRRNKA